MLIGARDVLLMISNKNICEAYMRSKSVTGLKVDMKELNKVSNDVSNYVF